MRDFRIVLDVQAVDRPGARHILRRILNQDRYGAIVDSEILDLGEAED